jgi:PAS domain S-box-containing protein
VSEKSDLPRDSALPLLEESAEELYDGAPCGYLSTRPDGTILRVNQTFLTWTGYERDALVGRKRFQDLLSPGGRIYHETHYAPLLRMQGSVREIAVEVVRADGRRLPALINSVMHHDEGGQPRVVRTTVFDATDRKEYEKELLRARQKAENADKAKASFISMISHEIRTPLSAIIGIGHLLEETELATSQKKYVRILRSSSEALMSLVNDILDFSKIESGTLTLEERPFDPREMVYGIVYAQQVKAHEKGVALEVEVDEVIPSSLVGDPVKIGQVLNNLIGNAVKFTQKGAVRVALRTDEVAEEVMAVRFTVRDTGIGIAPDRLSRVFDDYTQASYDIGMRYGGTGLGLGISKKLVELHGSTLGVESELGRGSTFSFVLRLAVPPMTEPAAPAESGPASPLAGLRALVADDNDVNVFVLGGLLRKWGIQYDVAVNGREAVERVKAKDYDLVLMDIHMPGGDGLAAAREIRAIERFAALPIFAVSGSMRMAEPHSIDTAGFTEFVGKPVNPDVLFTKISRHRPPRP